MYVQFSRCPPPPPIFFFSFSVSIFFLVFSLPTGPLVPRTVFRILCPAVTVALWFFISKGAPVRRILTSLSFTFIRAGFFRLPFVPPWPPPSLELFPPGGKEVLPPHPEPLSIRLSAPPHSRLHSQMIFFFPCRPTPRNNPFVYEYIVDLDFVSLLSLMLFVSRGPDVVPLPSTPTVSQKFGVLAVSPLSPFVKPTSIYYSAPGSLFLASKCSIF